MKKMFTCAVLCLLAVLTIAQNESDTTEIDTDDEEKTVFNKEITIFGSNNYDKHEYWQGLEFGINGYFMDDQFGLNNDPDYVFMELDFGRSFVLNINFAEWNKGIIGEKVRFMTGAGARFNRYAFKNSNYTLKQNETEIFHEKDSLRDFYTNFLNATYVTVPAFISIIPGKDPANSIHFSVGVIGSARLRSRIKQRFVMNGKKEKEITRDTYHLNPFMLDYSVRFGYGGFTAFATYSATQLFEKGKGPEFYPFSFGVSWNF